MVGFELSSQGDRGKNPKAEGQEATAEGTIPGQEQQQRALHGAAWEWAHPEGPCGPSRGESRCWQHSGVHQTHPKFHHQIPTPAGTSCAHPGWEQRGACSSLGITPGWDHNPTGIPWWTHIHPQAAEPLLSDVSSLTKPFFPYKREAGKKNKFTLGKKPHSPPLKPNFFWVPDKAIFSRPVGIWKSTLTQPSHHDSNNNYKMSNKTCL